MHCQFSAGVDGHKRVDIVPSWWTSNTEGKHVGGTQGHFSTFEELTDARISRSRIHELFKWMVVAICESVAESDSWTDIKRFGNEWFDWPKTFLRRENGIPSYDPFGRMFARLDLAGLATCIHQTVRGDRPRRGRAIHTDRKTLRGSFDTAAGRNPVHPVLGLAGPAHRSLAEIVTDTKSKEITATSPLLELLNRQGLTVTIDAMGCQPVIAAGRIAEYTTRYQRLSRCRGSRIGRD